MREPGISELENPMMAPTAGRLVKHARYYWLL